MKEAIVTIIQECEIMTDGDGHPFSETLVYRVEFEGEFKHPKGSTLVGITKVVNVEQLMGTPEVTAAQVLGK
jgi:hypothetical protein